MQLWDFLLAWGIHLNIICIIAQLYLIRDELMSQARYANVWTVRGRAGRARVLDALFAYSTLY